MFFEKATNLFHHSQAVLLSSMGLQKLPDTSSLLSAKERGEALRRRKGIYDYAVRGLGCEPCFKRDFKKSLARKEPSLERRRTCREGCPDSLAPAPGLL